MCICYIGKQGAAMESKIYRIQNLNCSDKRNRIKLVKAVMKIIKADKQLSLNNKFVKIEFTSFFNESYIIALFLRKKFVQIDHFVSLK